MRKLFVDCFHTPLKEQQHRGTLVPANSILDWDTFERIFKSKYAAQKTHAALMKGLGALKKKGKRRYTILRKDFLLTLITSLQLISPRTKF